MESYDKVKVDIVQDGKIKAYYAAKLYVGDIVKICTTDNNVILYSHWDKMKIRKMNWIEDPLDYDGEYFDCIKEEPDGGNVDESQLPKCLR